MGQEVPKVRFQWKRFMLYMAGVALIVLAARGCALSRCQDAAETLLPAEGAGTALVVPDTPPPEVVEIPLTVEYEVIPTQWITVYDHRAEACTQMALEEYVLGVVAGEMPVSFALEALKAQAVATRTYSVYGMRHGGCGTCKEADICTNSQCCQAYATVDKLRERWGEEFDESFGKLSKAVMETAGLVMYHDGEVIDALYHGSSAGGSTEDSENVFSAALPYLRAVASPNEIGSRQTGEVRCPFSEFAEKANAAYPDAGLTAQSVPEAVEVTSLFPSGRVETVRIGGTSVTGKQMRKLMGLDSAMFTVAFTDTEVVFSTAGFGHGVGMSQAGANGMAAAGATFEDILHHYYTDVTISEYTAPAAP